jgi:hypothetical protein
MSNWRVGNIQSIDSGDFSGPGFVLYDKTGKPCVMFGYSKQEDAKAGHEHIEAALASAASVTGLG